MIYIDPCEGEYREKADLILVSHAHFDHCDVTKIKEIQKEDTVVIAPNHCASKIEGNVKSLRPGQKISLWNISVKATDAYNYKRFRSPGKPFHPRG